MLQLQKRYHQMLEGIGREGVDEASLDLLVIERPSQRFGGAPIEKVVQHRVGCVLAVERVRGELSVGGTSEHCASDPSRDAGKAAIGTASGRGSVGQYV